MANLSTYLESALLNHVLVNSAYSSPAAVYCGLVSSDAVDADLEAGSLDDEIGSYTGDRPEIDFGSAAQVDGAATSKNTAVLDFEAMPACTVKYAIVCDSATRGAGNILYWCPLATPRAVSLNDTFRLPIDSLVCDLD